MSEITKTDDIVSVEATADAENTAAPADAENTAAPADDENTAVPADDENTSAPVQSGKEKAGKRAKRPKKDKFDVKKDIWYRGPLSYRHLKLLGWLCIVFTQISIVEGLKFRTIGTGNDFFLDENIMSLITPSALPLLLISVFAFLLKKRENYRNILVVNGALALAIAGLFVLIYERYILGVAGSILGGDRSDLARRLDQFLYSTGEYRGFVAFNIFIDMFICTLIMFFLDYEPKHFFIGKKLLIFRAFVALPLAYEVGSILLKIMATDHFIELPLWVSPFLTTKPPVSILMFLSIVRYIKLREKKFFATGRTREQYEAFLDTNVNSLQFSKHLIMIIVIYSLLDLVIVLLMGLMHSAIISVLTNTNITYELVMNAMGHVVEWGFGGTARMMDLIPIVLLFSYTRSHKQPLIDTAIPILGSVAIVIVYLDGVFQIIEHYLSKGMGALTDVLYSMESMI